MALLMALGATSTSAATPTACRARNTDTGKTFPALQTAVDAAHRGDRLAISGLCHGGTVIDKSLVIAGIKAPTSGVATLDGDGKTRVLLIEAGIRVTLRNLVIRDGLVDEPRWKRRRWGPRVRWMGGGIHNSGTLVLRDVVVRDNMAGVAGGGVRNVGTLTLEGGSRISGNKARGHGGGISNTGVLRLNGRSHISGNAAGGGGGVLNNGILTLNDRGHISGNKARMSGGYGGGVYGGDNGRSIIRLNDDSHISGNWSGSRGGGVEIDYVHGGTLTLNDRSHISGNAARGPGGGVASDGTVTLNDDSRISGNTTTHGGGGVAGFVTLTLNGSSRISGNEARYSGGGVEFGDITMNDSSSISSNTAHGEGGGVRNIRSILTLNDHSSISGNRVLFGPLAPGVGGGVSGGDIVLRDSSSITGNFAERGGGGVVGAGRSSVFICAPAEGANVYGNTPDDCLFE